MPQFEIRRLTGEETVPLRWAILRAGLPRETAVFPGDEAATSRHFGVLVDGLLVGVATIHLLPMPGTSEIEPAYQLRGMATAEEVRGLGVGGALLAACVAEARQEGGCRLWCNARAPAAGFYEKHGFTRFGEAFEIPTAGPHYLMARSL